MAHLITLPQSRTVARPSGRAAPRPSELIVVVRRWAWPVAAVTVVVWAVVAGWPHGVRAVGVLRHARPSWFVTAVGFQAAAVLALTVAYRAALGAVGVDLGLRASGGLALRTSTVSRVLPGGGPAAVLFAVRRLRARGVPGAAATAGVALHSTLALGGMAASLTVVGAVSVLSPVQAGAGAVAALVIVVGLGRALPRMLGRRVAASTERWRWSESVRTAVATIAAQPRAGRRAALAGGYSVVAASLELAALWAAVRAVGETLPVATVALGLGAAHAAAALPHTPGGVGMVEAAMTATYTGAGLEPAVALAGVFAYRLVGFWLPAGVGGLLFGRDAAATLRARRSRRRSPAR